MEFSPRAEFYSIDESFFEAVLPRGLNHQEYAKLIRDTIWERLRVARFRRDRQIADAGETDLGHTKPFGALAVLDRPAEVELMRSLPVTEISGIAGRRERRLQPFGITTCLDLANADRRLVRELLTASGEALWCELNGESVLPINTSRTPHKFLARGGSMGQAPSTDPIIVYAWLVRNLERLIEELDYHEVRAGRLGVQVWYKDGTFRESFATLEAHRHGSTCSWMSRECVCDGTGFRVSPHPGWRSWRGC